MVPVHLSHWYVYVIGCAPVHVPLVTVRVWPAFSWPEIVGSAVFASGATAYVAVYVAPAAGAVTLCVCVPPSDQLENWYVVPPRL